MGQSNELKESRLHIIGKSTHSSSTSPVIIQQILIENLLCAEPWVGFVDKRVNKGDGDILENVEDTGQDMSEASRQMGLCMVSSSWLQVLYLYDCPSLHCAVESVEGSRDLGRAPGLWQVLGTWWPPSSSVMSVSSQTLEPSSCCAVDVRICRVRMQMWKWHPARRSCLRLEMGIIRQGASLSPHPWQQPWGALGLNLVQQTPLKCHEKLLLGDLGW